MEPEDYRSNPEKGVTMKALFRCSCSTASSPWYSACCLCMAHAATFTVTAHALDGTIRTGVAITVTAVGRDVQPPTGKSGW